MQLVVDGTLCSGHGRCYSQTQGLLSHDDEGFVTPRDTLIAVAAGLEGQAATAREICPESAIAFVED
jgi:ferredoxin